MSKKHPLSPYHLRSNSPSRIFEAYDDKNEERSLLLILTTKVSRWRQKAPKEPWFMKPENQILTRLQRMDKMKLLKKKPLRVLQDESMHFLNPTYVKWNEDKTGIAREVEYSTDIKRYYREEIEAAMKGVTATKERLRGTQGYTKPPQQPKKSFLDALYSKTTIEETIAERAKESDQSSEDDDSHMEAGQPDNIGIPPGGQEEFKTPDESEDEPTSTQETTKTSNKRTMEEMMEVMQTRIDTLEKTVQNQGFQYELALNKAQTETPRKAKELLEQVENASKRMQEQEKKIEALTKFNVDEFVKKNQKIITQTTEKIMQNSITRLTNAMDQKHEWYRNLMVNEVQDEATKITQSMKKTFEAELKQLTNHLEEEHTGKLSAQLDSYSEEVITDKEQQIDELWDALQTVDAEMQQGDLTMLNRPLKLRLATLDDNIEKAKKEANYKTGALNVVLEAKLNEMEQKVESKVTALKKNIETLEEEIQERKQREPTTPEASTANSKDTQPRMFHNQPTYIPGSARKNLFAAPVQERAEVQLANDTAANMTTNVAKFEKATLHHDLHKSTVEIADLEDYYENLQGLCRSHQIPLVHRDQIRNERTCMPALISHMPEAIQSIAKQALYNKINSSFSEEPVILRNMITQNDEQDGYQVIYQIMSTFCHDLMDYPPTWGPAIDPNKDLWAYSKQLKRHRTQNGHKASYSNEEVAFEIIQQAMKIPKYRSLAQSLMASYVTTRQNNLDMAPFEKFAIISTLARVDLREQDNLPDGPIIHKGYAKEDDTGKPHDNGPRGRYPPPKMAKNRVTCTVCKTFGHNVPEQCCHFGAKLYHAQKYMEQHPDIAKANAEQYEKRYDASIVKQLIANKTLIAGHLPEDQQDTFIDEIIDGMMRDDYSSNDGISQLTSTTEQLSISTPSKEQC